MQSYIFMFQKVRSQPGNLHLFARVKCQQLCCQRLPNGKGCGITHLFIWNHAETTGKWLSLHDGCAVAARWSSRPLAMSSQFHFNCLVSSRSLWWINLLGLAKWLSSQWRSHNFSPPTTRRHHSVIYSFVTTFQKYHPCLRPSQDFRFTTIPL